MDIISDKTSFDCSSSPEFITVSFNPDHDVIRWIENIKVNENESIDISILSQNFQGFKDTFKKEYLINSIEN